MCNWNSTEIPMETSLGWGEGRLQVYRNPSIKLGLSKEISRPSCLKHKLSLTFSFCHWMSLVYCPMLQE
jgi:hypothetical protein